MCRRSSVYCWSGDAQVWHAAAFRENGIVVYGTRKLNESPTAVWVARASIEITGDRGSFLESAHLFCVCVSACQVHFLDICQDWFALHQVC